MMVRVAVFLFWVAVLMLFNLHVELWQWHQVTVVGMAIIITMLTYSSHCAKHFAWSILFYGWGNGGTESSSNSSRSHNQYSQWQSQDLKLIFWLQSPNPSGLHTQMSVWLGLSFLFHPKQPFLGLLFPQWLPESARYDVLSGNQEKAIATLKRIATENGAPMPLGKLIISRQVSAWPIGSPAWRPCACMGAGVLGWGMHVWVFVSEHGVDEGALGRTCKGNWATPICVFSPPSPKSVTWRI